MLFDDEGRPLVRVHTCNNDQEAAIVLAYLESRGVAARANSEIPHSILPITVGELGAVDIMVEQHEADRARRILKERRDEVIIHERRDNPGSGD